VLDVSDDAGDGGASSGVRVLAFDRPDVRNAFNFPLYRAVTEAITDAAADPAVRVVVLTGRGTAFTAGQDLKEMAEIATGTAPAGIEKGFRGLLDAVDRLDKPLVAAVNGAAIGLGFTLLAHCDLVVVAESARLRVPFAEMGVPPEAASSYLFPLLMGRQAASRVLLAADWITADEAVALGIAVQVSPDDRLLDDALALARRIAGFPPDAVQTIKRLVREPHVAGVRDARAREDEAFRQAFGLPASPAEATGPPAR
jgi:enoyl-CoA hydratase/carnithine racemase